MKAPSRSMPPMKEYPTVRYLWMLVFAISILTLLYFATNSIIVPAVVVLGFGALQVVGHISYKRSKMERKEDSICSFSRGLSAKSHDTWIVRAVYEALTTSSGFPVRPSDSLEDDLRIDPDDLDDLAFDIAERSCRSMDRTVENPKFDNVVTVLDMIEFFEHQPKLDRQVEVRIHDNLDS
ncbi:hypothetical protein MLD52_22115 [Puniceicoccaceae bacterium K14]|nr:hypothetical protein [Puniceicoccaceae bacterium K14]